MIDNNSVSICVPVIAQDYDELKTFLDKILEANVSLIEYRRDYLQNSQQENIIYTLLNDNIHNVEVIFTYRHYNEGGQAAVKEDDRFRSIEKALKMGCLTYLDIEEASAQTFFEFVDKDLLEGIKLIVSAHNFESTPSKEEILEQLRQNSKFGDIVKVAYKANSREDINRLKEAAKAFREECDKPLIVIGMGEEGKDARIYPEQLYSNLTFAPLDSKSGSAPGQVDYKTLKRLREEIV